MHRTHLPLTVWFWAIYLCATDKCGISAVLGAFLLFLGKSLGAAVGINAATLAVSAFLGLPGVAGIFLLSFFL